MLPIHSRESLHSLRLERQAMQITLFCRCAASSRQLDYEQDEVHKREGYEGKNTLCCHRATMKYAHIVRFVSSVGEALLSRKYEFNL